MIRYTIQFPAEGKLFSELHTFEMLLTFTARDEQVTLILGTSFPDEFLRVKGLRVCYLFASVRKVGLCV